VYVVLGSVATHLYSASQNDQEKGKMFMQYMTVWKTQL